MAGQRGKTGVILVGLFVFLAMAAGMASLLLTRTPDLMGGARPIANVTNWFPIHGEPLYHWVDNDRILYLDRHGPVPHLKKLRISTGATADYGALPFSAAIPANPGVWARFSPDSRYLLWIDLQRGPIYPRALEVESLWSTPRVIRWAYSGSIAPPIWLPDSKRWAHIAGKIAHRQVAIFDTQNPGKPQTRDLTPTQSARWAGILPDGTYFIQRTGPHDRTSEKGTERVLEIGVFAPPWDAGNTGKETRIAVPWGKYTSDWSPKEVSPDGTRLLWRELRTKDRWRRIYLRVYQRFPFLPFPRSLGIEQVDWVSDREGNNFRLLGIREMTMPPRYSELRWTPSGRSVSFICDGTLYVRPVP